MSISAEEKNRYLREAAIVLAKEGFQLDEVHTDRLCILLDGSPLCEVTESGGITYRNENIDEPERLDAKDKVYEVVRTTAEYMRQMEAAPSLKADGLEDGYKVLADFNGTVLAGVQSKHGVHFVTWDWAYGHTGVCHGHYFMENYAGAKQDFAIRSGLIQKEQLFTPEQLTEIYRCCADSVDGDFFELTGEQEKMIRSVQQQIGECVPDLDERIRQQEEALEQVAQEQTMYMEQISADEAAVLVRLLRQGLSSHLTETQRRRLWKYCVEGKPVRLIAKEECAYRNAVWKSIQAAKEKMFKFFVETGCAKPRFRRDR